MAMNSVMPRDLIATSAASGSGAGERAAVVGLGATGLSCARYFTRRGVPCFVVDSRREPPGLADLRRECPDVEAVVGEIPASALRGAGRLVVSPGVPLNEPAVAAAIAAGVPACGDVDLFMREARAPVAGITGSNGKSTVVTLLGGMAAAAGIRAASGGNLGTPVLDLLAADAELYLLELSSFQLERAGALNLALACALNLSPDHIDRHGDMQGYHRAKHRIFPGCRAVVYNRDDALSRPLRADTVPALSFGLGEPDLKDFGLRRIGGAAHLCRGGDALLPAGELRVPGRHNIANALAALAIGAQLGLPMDAMLAALRAFPGLPHRCQFIAEAGGVRFVNDSKATNPGAALAALQGFAAEQGKLVLIAGGQSKGADFKRFGAAAARACRSAVLLGEAAFDLEAACAPLPTARASSMEEAVALAAGAARPGDTVLLSPACASYDMFAGHAERGAAFAAAAKQLQPPSAHPQGAGAGGPGGQEQERGGCQP